MFVCVCVRARRLTCCVPWCTCVDQGTTCGNWFSPFMMWALANEFMSPGLMANALPAKPSS